MDEYERPGSDDRLQAAISRLRETGPKLRVRSEFLTDLGYVLDRLEGQASRGAPASDGEAGLVDQLRSFAEIMHRWAPDTEALRVRDGLLDLARDHEHLADEIKQVACVYDRASDKWRQPTPAEVERITEALLVPVDEMGRGPSYWRGFADGRMAEKAKAPWGPDESRAVARALSFVGSARGLSYPPPGSDAPPFAPELADAPLVTGESGAPTPLVVDQPVHESTLPAELADGHTSESDPGPQP